MRTLLLTSLLLCFGASYAGAADASDKDLNSGEHKAVDNKTINTIDPVTGDKIDPNVAPVAAKAHDGKDILIGASSVDSAAVIKKNPDKYIDAALADKKSEEK